MMRWRIRSAAAWGIVVIGFGGILVADRLVEQTGWAVCFPELERATASQGDLAPSSIADGSAGKDGISLRYGLSDDFPLVLFGCLAEAPDAASGLAAGFEEEVIALSAFSNPQAVSLRTGGVVGIVCDGNREEVMQNLLSQLEMHGWYGAYADGDVRAGSLGGELLKREGRYRWLHFSCSDNGARTSVVFAFREEESVCRDS